MLIKILEFRNTPKSLDMQNERSDWVELFQTLAPLLKIHVASGNSINLNLPSLACKMEIRGPFQAVAKIKRNNMFKNIRDMENFHKAPLPVAID